MRNTTKMSRAFEISARARASLNSGTNIEIEDEAAKYAPYDASARPGGLISLAGATQSFGEEMLKDRMDEFAKTYSLKQGKLGHSARRLQFKHRLTRYSYRLWRFHRTSRYANHWQCEKNNF